MKKWIDITTFKQLKLEAKDGMGVRCKIHPSFSTFSIYVEGKITIKDKDIFICQNEIAGIDCEDKKGYKHSRILEKSLELSNMSAVQLEVETGTKKHDPINASYVVYVVGKNAPTKNTQT